ncbi:hypothetical protein ACVW1A_004275 [Bradyrhizobium sp. LB1.3]
MHAAEIYGDGLGRIGYLGISRVVPEFRLGPNHEFVCAIALAEHHAVARGRHVAQRVVQRIRRLVAALAVIGEDARQVVDGGRGELRCSVGVEQAEIGLRIGIGGRRVPVEHLVEIGRAHAGLVGVDQRVQDRFGLHRLVNAEILGVGLRGVARFRNDDGFSRCCGRDGAQCCSKRAIRGRAGADIGVRVDEVDRARHVAELAVAFGGRCRRARG